MHAILTHWCAFIILKITEVNNLSDNYKRYYRKIQNCTASQNA